jgi:hypothetical protein
VIQRRKHAHYKSIGVKHRSADEFADAGWWTACELDATSGIATAHRMSEEVDQLAIVKSDQYNWKTLVVALDCPIGEPRWRDLGCGQGPNEAQAAGA